VSQISGKLKVNLAQADRNVGKKIEKCFRLTSTDLKRKFLKIVSLAPTFVNSEVFHPEKLNL